MWGADLKGALEGGGHGEAGEGGRGRERVLDSAPCQHRG